MSDDNNDLTGKRNKKGTDLRSIKTPKPFLQLIEGTRDKALPRTAAEKAQELIYEAWDADTYAKRVALAEKALETYPDCADAYVMLAEETADHLFEAIELYRKGVEAGTRTIGKKHFDDIKGHFWGYIETRPYMRAKAGLAGCLWEGGHFEEALKHYREMLELNPSDNQGIRYIIAGCLLYLGLEEELEKLLGKYDEVSCEWLYTKALFAFMKRGDAIDSLGLLRNAIKANMFVPIYLLNRKEMPEILPDMYSFGSEDEAVVYVERNGSIWRKIKGSLSWLASHSK
jgi:tetratricopeptide (TPR) repeat protein